MFLLKNLEIKMLKNFILKWNQHQIQTYVIDEGRSSFNEIKQQVQIYVIDEGCSS